MATIRRRTPSRRGTVELDHWYDLEFRFGPAFRDRGTIEDAWNAFGEEFLANYINHNPGSRPWAWWTFEAKHPAAESETTAEYLTRHKLWTRGERTRFEAMESET